MSGCAESNGASTGKMAALVVVSGGVFEYALCMIGCMRYTVLIDYIAEDLEGVCK